MIHDESLPDEDMEALLNAPVRFWHCPIPAHRNQRDENGWPKLEVEWRGKIAHCLFPDCGRTSVDTPGHPPKCSCGECSHRRVVASAPYRPGVPDGA